VRHRYTPLPHGILRHERIAVTTVFVPRPSLGTPKATPAAPFAPATFDALLRHRPARAATLLAAMRPALRDAQCRAHAALADAPAPRIAHEWADLVARADLSPAPVDDEATPCASVYEPELLALRDPADAQRQIAALSPTQRVAQAAAQAAWLAGFGYPVTLDEVLAGWGDRAERTV
jgi:hypothetical protein